MTKRTLAVLIAAATLAACDSPTAPTQYICATQPRGYYNPATGVTTYEVDHYVQSFPCPAVPLR